MKVDFRFERLSMIFLAGTLALSACGSATLRTSDGAAGSGGSGGSGPKQDGGTPDTASADGRSDRVADATIKQPDASSDRTAEAGTCGGLGQTCCASNACSVAGSVCSSSGTCDCPIGSHDCRSSSCISNSSLCDVTEYPIMGTAPKPSGLALGSDGNVWFTDVKNLKVGRMTPAGTVVEYPVSDPPTTIASGPDGNLWFTEHGHPSGGIDQIGKLDTSGTHLDEFDVSADALSSDPGNTLGGGGMIIAGPDKNLWFTESVPGKIARMTTAGVHTAYQVRAFYPLGIAVGPDNNIWYALQDGVAIGWVTTSGANNTEVPLPDTTDDPQYLAVGADNAFWITESTANLITHYLPSTGKITQYPIPTLGSFAGPIVLGPDGNMWTIGFISNNIIRISAAGVITEFPLPTAGAQPVWIVKGPDVSGSGTLWISESAIGKIARVIP